MYGKLWSFVNHYIDAGHALAVYLPILIVGWTIIGTVCVTLNQRSCLHLLTSNYA